MCQSVGSFSHTSEQIINKNTLEQIQVQPITNNEEKCSFIVPVEDVNTSVHKGWISTPV
jgi:hypothetical protein